VQCVQVCSVCYVWGVPVSVYVCVCVSVTVYLLIKVHIVKAVVFPVIVYRCESWTVKKAEHCRRCFQAVVLEKILKSPLDKKKIKPVNPKGNQP